jgi:hypothetical protein
MLIPLTVEFHLTTLPGVEDVAILSSMVLCGVCEGLIMLQVVVYK